MRQVFQTKRGRLTSAAELSRSLSFKHLAVGGTKVFVSQFIMPMPLEYRAGLDINRGEKLRIGRKRTYFCSVEEIFPEK